jgi:hypothetical protein
MSEPAGPQKFGLRVESWKWWCEPHRLLWEESESLKNEFQYDLAQFYFQDHMSESNRGPGREVSKNGDESTIGLECLVAGFCAFAFDLQEPFCFCRGQKFTI